MEMQFRMNGQEHQRSIERPGSWKLVALGLGKMCRETIGDFRSTSLFKGGADHGVETTGMDSPGKKSTPIPWMMRVRIEHGYGQLRRLFVGTCC